MNVLHHLSIFNPLLDIPQGKRKVEMKAATLVLLILQYLEIVNPSRYNQTMKRQIWVNPLKDRWEVCSVHPRKTIKICRLKVDAVSIGVAAAKRSKAELFIRKRNGVIGWKNSYGNDPFPPKG